MKNLVLSFIALFIVTAAHAQKPIKPGITDIDRMNIREILKTKGEQTNPDYVWEHAKVVELKDLPKEEYETSYLKTAGDSVVIVMWKSEGPAKRDFVLAYKTEKNGTVYFRNISTNELLRPAYAEQGVQYAKTAQSNQKAPRQKGGGGILKTLGGVAMQVGGQFASQRMGGIFSPQGQVLQNGQPAVVTWGLHH